MEVSIPSTFTDDPKLLLYFICRRVSVELWGTVVRMYTMTWFGRPKNPTLLLSLAGAEAVRALDYRKRPYVFRLKTDNVHCLFQAMDLDDMNAWIEHLQAGKTSHFYYLFNF
jgi:hypothetical protein